MTDTLQTLVGRIRACTLCAGEMALAPRPVLQVSASARLLIAGQAPGNLARKSGRPFTDPSGVRLRDWLGISEPDFYDARRVAIVPMGFCFPGYDARGGDRPPMKRCAATWRSELLAALPEIRTVVLVGAYAQAWHLPDRTGRTLSETVANWQTFAAEGVFPTPHPSWRNTAWLKRHPWFETDVLPALRASVRSCLQC